MGKNRGGQKRGTQRRHFRDGRQNVWKKQRPSEDQEEQPSKEAGWEPFVTENPSFQLYYKRQAIVPEEEWDNFLTVLRKPLPAVFRVNSRGQFANEIRTQIQDEFAGSLNCEVDGVEEQLVKPLPWYPGKLAWHLNFSRMQLRKNQTLARLHQFLKRENEIGNITRQEAVSMIPPLFLDVQPHHHVLDMCAAPGSKTFQLLEMIHGDDTEPLSHGLVIANDVDVQRCHLLVHQTKRICSPNVIVTNHEAQHFPGLKKDKDIHYQFSGGQENGLTGCGGGKKTELNEERGLVFDCILCDVPCSGDGTIRKAPDIWKKWNIGHANGLHRLQIQIAMRGVALLRVGGKLVYSTCSLNPVENEAVVGEVLRQSGGCVELLDVSNELPELKRRRGLRTWKVRDKGLWIASYKNVRKHRLRAVFPSMFPTGDGTMDESALGESALGDEDQLSSKVLEEESFSEHLEASKENDLVNIDNGEDEDCEFTSLPLERCLRVLPHDQDTGGFFVAVFRKVTAFKVEQPMNRPMRAKAAASRKEVNNVLEPVESKEQTSITPNEEGLRAVDKKPGESPKEATKGHETNVWEERNASHLTQNPIRLQQQGKWKGVDPVLFLTDETLIDSIIAFYGITDTLKLRGHLVTRSEDTSRLKRIYYVSESVANVMRLNFRTGEQMKITSLGLKVFERQGGKEDFSKCAFRIASEGLSLLLPHLTRQLVRASKPDFQLLLSQKTTQFSLFSDSVFVTSLGALDPGCCVVVLDGGEEDACIQSLHVTAIGCWKGRSNLSLLIPKDEAANLLERLFGDRGIDDLQASNDEDIHTLSDVGKDLEGCLNLTSSFLDAEDTSEPRGPNSIISTKNGDFQDTNHNE